MPSQENGSNELDVPAMRSPLPKTVRRLGWLHFANDFTLDFITPLLPVGVPTAWLGVMEGAADAVGQVLKLFSGRRSDATGRRVWWVAAGYTANAVARPLAGFGMLFAWPAWIVACRVADRVGKGLRGSATDALIADWTSGGERARAYALMRTQDHLGATGGAVCAAAVAWWLALDYDHPQRLVWVILALVLPMVWMLRLCRGLEDNPAAAPKAGPPPGWWPRSHSLRMPLAIIAVASIGAKLAPLLVLVQVAGIPLTPEQAKAGAAWPVWGVCLAWGALALIQAGAASVAGALTERFGATAFLAAGWAVGTGLFAALIVAQGPWLVAAGAAWGVLAGLTEGAEKTWLAELTPQSERALAFGAMALLGAAAALAGSSAVGAGLALWGPVAFALPSACLAIGTAGVLVKHMRR